MSVLVLFYHSNIQIFFSPRSIHVHVVVTLSYAFTGSFSPSLSSSSSLAADVLSLKELSRLELLRALGREHYSNIPLLPLPSHLQQYVSHYRDWGKPPPPLKTLCPMEDRDEEEEEELEGEKEEDEVASKRKRRRRRRRSSGEGDHDAAPLVMVQRGNNRQRLVFLNINGLMFQVCLTVHWVLTWFKDNDGNHML